MCIHSSRVYVISLRCDPLDLQPNAYIRTKLNVKYIRTMKGQAQSDHLTREAAIWSGVSMKVGERRAALINGLHTAKPEFSSCRWACGKTVRDIEWSWFLWTTILCVGWTCWTLCWALMEAFGILYGKNHGSKSPSPSPTWRVRGIPPWCLD